MADKRRQKPLNGTLESLRYRRKPSSSGMRNSSALPLPPVPRAVRPTLHPMRHFTMLPTTVHSRSTPTMMHTAACAHRRAPFNRNHDPQSTTVPLRVSEQSVQGFGSTSANVAMGKEECGRDTAACMRGRSVYRGTHRWMYSLGSSGGSYCTIHCTAGISRPRAATSVQSSTPLSALLNSRNVAVRRLCFCFPWMLLTCSRLRATHTLPHALPPITTALSLRENLALHQLQSAIRVSVDALCALLDCTLGISPVTSYSGVRSYSRVQKTNQGAKCSVV